MNQNELEEFLERGKNYALYLLNYRNRSKFEIEEKLKKKQYPEEVVVQILRYLEEKGFVDDRKFAIEWTRKCIKKGIAHKRVEYELRQKGIEESLIKEVFKQIFSQIDEKKMALQILYRKKYLPISDELKGEKKLKYFSKMYQFLLRRGFPNTVAREVIEGLRVQNS